MKTQHKKVNIYRRRAYLWLVFGAFVLTAGCAYIFWPRPKALEVSQQPLQVETPVTETKVTIPESANLNVPYAPQAPFSNWTVHEESCEEAAIYMYHGYLENLTYTGNRVPDAEADSVYRQMKAWEVDKYGSEPDLTMTALGEFARSYYGYTQTVKANITAEDIKEAVSAGHPVIVPVMTHSLENSMYGPISVYHVLLIKGYDAAGVITNDAGVGNGVDKHYDWNILWQAIDAQTAKMGQDRDMLYLTK